MSLLSTVNRSAFRVAPLLTRSISKMSPIKTVFTENAPLPVGPYSQACKVNGTVYVSGQLYFNAQGKLIEGTITEKADLVLKNVKAVLEASNSSLELVVKSNVFLADMANFKEFNEVYSKYFSEHKPARSCVAVKTLPLNADMEMEVIAVEKN